MAIVFFPAIVERGAGGYGVFFPDLPGCTAAGDTIQEAALNAEEALAGHLETSVEHGEEVPPPSGLDAIERDPDVDEAARILVRAEIAGSRAVRVNITLPGDALKAIDHYAESHGMTRSGMIVTAARRLMSKAA